LWFLPKVPHAATVSIYLGMGWLGLAPLWQYYQAVGIRGLRWALWGAALYTFGAICELTKWPIIWPDVVQSHEVLHVSDMGATFCHFVFIVRYVIPYVPRTAESEPVVHTAKPAATPILSVET
jgi:hemolysin III